MKVLIDGEIKVLRDVKGAWGTCRAVKRTVLPSWWRRGIAQKKQGSFWGIY